jgi:hypothetical protein
MKNKPKKYEIETFENLINVVNKENFKRLSVDLLLWLNHNVNTMEKIREKHPKECEGKENWEIMKSSFIWIDDGKNDLKEVKLTNTKTGEIKKIKIKKK